MLTITDDSNRQWPLTVVDTSISGTRVVRGQALREALGIDELPPIDFTVGKAAREAQNQPAA